MMAPKKKGTASRLKAGTAKAVDKDTVIVNLKGVTKRRRRARIAEGQYLVKLVRAQAGTTKDTNNPMVTWLFEIVEDAKYNGTHLYYNTVLTDESLWSFRGVLEALGVKAKDSTMKIPLGRLKDRTCGVEVVDGEPYNNRISSEINDLFPKDQLEEDEEEEDEEFEDEEDADDDDSDNDDEEEDEDEDDEDDEEDDEEIDLDEEEL